MSLMWSMILRLISSGTHWSKQRLPASMWKMGIFRRLAAYTPMQLLVSPRMSTPSGRTSRSTASVRSMTRATVAEAVSAATSRKWSGFGRASCSKNTPFSS